MNRNKRKFGKTAAVIFSLLLVAALAAGGTLAFLTSKTAEVKNTFTPARVENSVIEDFDGTIKKNVNVQNTGDIDAYLRVKLITYRVKDSGENKNVRIGGTADIPSFQPGIGWVERDGYYYYTKPVAPTKTPDVPLIGAEGIKLESYTDTDGGVQVIEVMAEAIQAVDNAAADAWHVNIQSGSVTPINH